MKNLRNLVLAGTIATAGMFLPQLVRAQSPDSVPEPDSTATEQVQKDNFSAELSFDIANKSRFWGIPFLEGPHYKQSVSATYENFTASVTGNVDVDKNFKFFDVDTHMGYAQPLPYGFEAGVGYLRFDFDLGEGWDNASLAYVSITSNSFLNPTITYNRLFGFGGGEYIEGELSEKIPITGWTGINLKGKLGFNDKALREKTDFTHLEGILETPIQIDNIKLTPRMNYFHSLSGDVKTGFLGGFNVTVNF